MVRRHSSRAAVWLAIAVSLGAGIAVCRWRSAPPPRLRAVDRLLDRIERDSRSSESTRDAALAASVRHRWTARQIEEQWARAAGARGATLRSPALDVGTLDDLEAIVVTMPAGAASAVLL